jgi:Trk K+ transport system NAD-binding subunit
MKLLNDTGDTRTLLVIGGEAAKGGAAHLADEWDVQLLSDETDIVDGATNAPYTSHRVELTASDLEPFASRADAAVVITEHDRVALRLAVLLNTIASLDDVFVRVDDPENRRAFEDVDCRVLEAGALFRSEIERQLGASEDAAPT